MTTSGKNRFFSSLTFKVSLLLVFLFIINGVTLVLWDQHRILKILEADTQQAYATIAAELAPAFQNDVLQDPHRLQATLDSLAQELPGMELFVLDGQGNVLSFSGYVKSSELYHSRVPLEPIKRFIMADSSEYPIELPIPTARKLDYVFSAAPLPDAEHGYLLVSLVEGGPDEPVSWWEEYGPVAWKAALFSLLIAALTGFILWLRFTRRLEQLDQAVSDYRLGEPVEELPRNGNDEIARVATHLEQMMDKIETMFGELARKEQFRREFIAQMSHELQTPLTILQGNLESLANHWEHLSQENISLKLTTLFKQVQQLSQLIEDLSAIATLDTGQMPVHPEAFSLEELVEDVMLRFLPEIEAKGLTFERKYRSEGALVLADPLRIRQVINNLVSNALKYTPAGGTIRVVVAKEGREVRLMVEDTGTGIAPEEQEKIFDNFYRGDEAQRQGIPGTGLGLGICRRILELHNRQLELESTPGKGSSFFFTLPCYEEEPDPPADEISH